MEIRQAISMYLTAKAYNDAEFKAKFENPAKSLDECVLFLQAKMLEKVTEEQKKGGAGVVIPSDDEVFALAEQYYIDEDIKVDGSAFNNLRIVSAAATTFTDEEKAKMREDAINEFKESIKKEERQKDLAAKKKPSKAKKPAQPVIVPDTPAKTSDKPAKKNEETSKPKVIQMELDW